MMYKGLNFVTSTLPPETPLDERNYKQRGQRAAFLPPQPFVIWGHTEKVPTRKSKSGFPPHSSSASTLFLKPALEHRDKCLFVTFLALLFVT